MHQSEQNSHISNLLKQKTNPALKSRGESQFFGLTDKDSSMAVALKFVLASGSQKAIHYHDIISPIDFDGNSRITLLTSRISIIIEGRNLGDLFDYIIQHRVKWVEEPQESFTSEESGKLAVNSIQFEDPE